MIITPCLAPGFRGRLYTLDPLFALGPDALAPDPAIGIAKVCLSELAVGWDNVFQEIVVRRASDVFAAAAADGAWYDLLPPTARLVSAILRFQMDGIAQPYFAEIRPPYTLILTPPGDTQLLERWCATHGFVLLTHPTPPS